MLRILKGYNLVYKRNFLHLLFIHSQVTETQTNLSSSFWGDILIIQSYLKALIGTSNFYVKKCKLNVFLINETQVFFLVKTVADRNLLHFGVLTENPSNMSLEISFWSVPICHNPSFWYFQQIINKQKLWFQKKKKPDLTQALCVLFMRRNSHTQTHTPMSQKRKQTEKWTAEHAMPCQDSLLYY